MTIALKAIIQALWAISSEIKRKRFSSCLLFTGDV